ncbi:MAG: hypothetical protein ACOYOK_02575 [Pseudobdellovibrionaceae bacterium]
MVQCFKIKSAVYFLIAVVFCHQAWAIDNPSTNKNSTATVKPTAERKVASTTVPSENILFDGYYKVLSGFGTSMKHIGFVVSRYEFDPSKKQFKSYYFLKLSTPAITESLKAVADENLNPISYEYTSVNGKDTKTIDANFSNNQMKAVITTNGKKQTVSKTLKKGTFLSTFLVYLILKSPQGLTASANYNYPDSIAEEDAEIYKGSAQVIKEEVYQKYKVFRVKNIFKNSEFISFVNAQGEVLSTQSSGQGITSELVATSQEAFGNIPFSPKLLTSVFGFIPEGKKNIIAQTQLPAPPSGKFEGVPPGQGIIIKPGSKNE